MLKVQIAKEIFLMSLSSMKRILDLQKYKLGKDSEDFIYYKSQIMEITYTNLKRLFRQLEQEKIIEKCFCGAKGRKGYSDCLCGGSGFTNKK